MKDWDSLFGDVPESFSRRVRDTVDRRERQKSATRPAFRLRPGYGLQRKAAPHPSAARTASPAGDAFWVAALW